MIYIIGKLLTRLQFFFKLHFNRRSVTKLWAPKVARVPTFGISGFPLGSLGTKSHLDARPVARHKEYYKGEGGGFPQVRAVVSLFSPSLPVAPLSTKSAATTN
jgi:hypothetical protein